MGGTVGAEHHLEPVRLRKRQVLLLVVVGATTLGMLSWLCWHLEHMERARLGAQAVLDNGISHLPGIVFVSGLLCTALLLWFLRTQMLRQEALRRRSALNRALFSNVLDASDMGILIFDANQRVVWLTETFLEYFGIPSRDLLGADLEQLARTWQTERVVEHPERLSRELFSRSSSDGTRREFRVLPRRRRQERWLEHWSRPIESGLFAGGRIDLFYDVTSRKRVASAQQRLMQREGDLQNQLRQSQRLEAVGKLAGGVAHDFNNILQVIIGRAYQLLSVAPGGGSETAWLTEVVDASEKAADLTRQLLAFGRRQHLERRLLEPNRLVRDHVRFLRRLIGEHIELRLRFGKDLDHVLADRTQLEQVLMNLCVNARDAMPDGGHITITTASCREIPVPGPGDTARRATESYVKITVSDSGSGIPAKNIDRVCEPFFSTKAPGRGTGLGLSTVHGIVHQHAGFMEIESFVGEGTSISVYLPAAETAEVKETAAPSDTPAQGSETILVVEDEPSVRSLAVETLSYGGYTVLTAEDGEEGLEVLLAKVDVIDLVFSDVVMPRMGGMALVEAARARGIGVPVLLTSGYGEDTLSPHLDVSVLAKPYSPIEMLQRVRQELDSRPLDRELVGTALPRSGHA